MLMAHPAVLRDLVEQYTALEMQNASAADSPQVRRRMDDVAYTLCVSTGTRDVAAALIAARGQVPGVRMSDATSLTRS
ncbi:DUF5133 domain-containing protein [Streptomyces sp. NPDC051322]|uniref:DUF5133 domain-containing protein n=1 Tax=Streptomyces sp. NPDC051322 TaxID=3154645 RepID=UPI00344FECC4